MYRQYPHKVPVKARALAYKCVAVLMLQRARGALNTQHKYRYAFMSESGGPEWERCPNPCGVYCPLPPPIDFPLSFRYTKYCTIEERLGWLEI